MIRTMYYHHTTHTLKDMIEQKGLSFENIRRGIKSYSVIAMRTPIDTAKWTDEETLNWLVSKQQGADELTYYANFKL